MNPGAPRSRAGALWGLAALSLLAAGAFAAAFPSALPPCPFRALTGLPCATCGSTRAALALLRLDLGAALRWNPLAAIGLPLFVAAGLTAGALWLLGRDVPEPRLPLALRVASLAAIAANWVYLLAVRR
jgi:hypothetical protein